jgi:hypothetical protein
LEFKLVRLYQCIRANAALSVEARILSELIEFVPEVVEGDGTCLIVFTQEHQL